MEGMIAEAISILKPLGWVFGSSLVTLVISKRLNKRTDDVKTALLEQEFYKNLVEDYQKELKDVKNKLEKIVEQNTKLIDKDEVNSKTIEEQSKNLSKWENYCEQLKRAVKDRDKTNSILLREIELLEKKE
jgi:cobalamin biosynthesis protein CobD/CbiB